MLAREPQLIERHYHYFPRLPLDHINVLVVDEIGKTYSGTGMDTNVIGYRGVRDGEDLTKPVIHQIAALNLSPKSQGNAIGVGLADFITRRLRDAIDEDKTFLNSFTTGHMGRAKIPVALKDDQELFDTLAGRYGEHGWLFIPNTLHLETLYASEDLRARARSKPTLLDRPRADRINLQCRPTSARILVLLFWHFVILKSRAIDEFPVAAAIPRTRRILSEIPVTGGIVKEFIDPLVFDRHLANFQRTFPHGLKRDAKCLHVGDFSRH